MKKGIMKKIGTVLLGSALVISTMVTPVMADETETEAETAEETAVETEEEAAEETLSEEEAEAAAETLTEEDADALYETVDMDEVDPEDASILAETEDEAVLESQLEDIASGEYDIDESYGVDYIGDFEKVVSGYIVLYPDTLESSKTKWPVVVWANGTACAPVLYWTALTQMASEGYIVVASSETMAADGTNQVGEVDYILGLNEDPDSIFYGKVDTDKIGAAGHSQGGRSTVNAAQSDSRIKAAVSVAGSNFKSEVKGLTTPTLFITGTADMVVMSSLWVKPAYGQAEGPAAYAAVNGGIHTTICTSPDSIVHYMMKWFDAYLLNDNSSRQVFMSGGELFNDSGWKNVASKNVELAATASVFGSGNVIVIVVIVAVLVVIAGAAVVLKKKKTAKVNK